MQKEESQARSLHQGSPRILLCLFALLKARESTLSPCSDFPHHVLARVVFRGVHSALSEMWQD